MSCIFENNASFLDVLILTETWFKEYNTQNIPNSKTYHTLSKSSRSDGVWTYVKKYIFFQPITDSEGGYGINTQVERSKKMTTVNFMGYDLNKLFWIFVDRRMW